MEENTAELIFFFLLFQQMQFIFVKYLLILRAPCYLQSTAVMKLHLPKSPQSDDSASASLTTAINQQFSLFNDRILDSWLKCSKF